MSDELLWDDAKVFLAVARCGTLTGAARQLGGGVATISRRIERLEAALQVPLFARHQSGYRLTDEGEALLPRAEVLEEAARVFSAQASIQNETMGRVRLATAENLANPLIIPSLPTLLRAHPKLEIEIITDVAAVNLHSRDADLALRMIKPDRGNIRARRVGSLGFGLYASSDYFKQRIGGRENEQFNQDQFIGWSEAQSHLPAAKWIDNVVRGKPYALVTTTLSAQLSAAEAGIGMAILPHFLAEQSGLVRHTIEVNANQPIWLAIHNDLANSRRVRVVADHLAQVVRDASERLSGFVRGPD